ncbi:MAG: hypothetical protein OFPII_39780 [Osedax symbiont Rs1]|nr:MAG: hypothetical protein OFPII_39780 [Osedax symbiont Rs1]
MGVPEDVEGLKGHWPTLTLASKIFFSALIAIQFMSIASLADNVYKFKGFMAEAVIQWHKVTLQLVDVFNLNVEIWYLDYWTVTFLAMVPYLIARWKIINLRLKITHLFMLPTNLLLPFYFEYSGHFFVFTACFIYISVLIAVFWPPLDKKVAIIGFQMILPPILVAIVAAIAEGWSRPLV